MLRFFGKVILVLVIALLLCVGADYAYRRTYNLSYSWPQNLLIKSAIADKYQIVSLGNSHATDGITFKLYKLRSLQLALVAQPFEYDLAALKMYQNQIAEGAIIIVNISPISFSQEKPNVAGSSQFRYYDGRLSPLVIPNLQVGDYLQSQILPFVRSVPYWRSAYDKEVRQDTTDTFAQNWNLPPEQKPEEKEKSEPVKDVVVPQEEKKIDSGSRILVKKTAQQQIAETEFESDERLQASVIAIFDKWHKPKDFGKEYFDSNRKDLEALVNFAQKKKWRVVFVNVPVSQRLMDGLGQEYFDVYVNQQLKKANIKGVEYIEFKGMDTFVKNARFFSNSDHLSRLGALIYSHWLLEQLIERGYLSSDVDGYVGIDDLREAITD